MQYGNTFQIWRPIRNCNLLLSAYLLHKSNNQYLKKLCLIFVIYLLFHFCYKFSKTKPINFKSGVCRSTLVQRSGDRSKQNLCSRQRQIRNCDWSIFCDQAWFVKWRRLLLIMNYFSFRIDHNVDLFVDGLHSNHEITLK